MEGCPGIDPDCSCSDNSCPDTCVEGVCFAQVDMKAFEIGPDVEGTFVSLRATGTTGSTLSAADILSNAGWYEIGKIGGSTRSIDIDASFPGFAPGGLRRRVEAS